MNTRNSNSWDKVATPKPDALKNYPRTGTYSFQSLVWQAFTVKGFFHMTVKRIIWWHRSPNLANEVPSSFGTSTKVA